MIWILAAIFVVVTYLPAVPPREARAGLLFLALLALLSFRWTNRWRTAVTLSILASFIAAKSPAWGIMAVVASFLGLEFIEWLSSKDGEFFEQCVSIIAVIGMLMSLHGMIQALNLDPTSYHRSGFQAMGIKTNVVAAMLDNRNTYGAFLAIAAPAMFHRFKWWGLLVLPAIIASQSTGPLLALLASGFVAFLSICQFKTRMVYGVTAIASVVPFVWLVDPLHNSLSGRLEVWGTALKIWLNHWVFGAGPGSYWITRVIRRGAEDDNLKSLWWQYAHNEYLQWAFEIGLVGTVILVGYVVSIAIPFIRHDPFPERMKYTIGAMLVALAVSSMFHFTMHLAPTILVGLVVLGMAEGYGKRSKALA